MGPLSPRRGPQRSGPGPGWNGRKGAAATMPCAGQGRTAEAGARTPGGEMQGALVDRASCGATPMGPSLSTVTTAGPRSGPRAWPMPRAAQARASSGTSKQPLSSSDEEGAGLGPTADSSSTDPAVDEDAEGAVPPGHTSASARAASSAAMATPDAEQPAEAAARAIAAIANAAFTAAVPGRPEAFMKSLPSEKSAMTQQGGRRAGGCAPPA
jgi:hypothetical protein